MDDKPRSLNEPIVNAKEWVQMLVGASITTVGALYVYQQWFRSIGISKYSLSHYGICDKWTKFTHAYYAPELPTKPCDVFTGKLICIILLLLPLLLLLLLLLLLWITTTATITHTATHMYHVFYDTPRT
jgi:hypothetical protein